MTCVRCGAVGRQWPHPECPYPERQRTWLAGLGYGDQVLCSPCVIKLAVEHPWDTTKT